jgi:hypothetical protein
LAFLSNWWNSPLLPKQGLLHNRLRHIGERNVATIAVETKLHVSNRSSYMGCKVGKASNNKTAWSKAYEKFIRFRQLWVTFSSVNAGSMDAKKRKTSMIGPTGTEPEVATMEAQVSKDAIRS